MARESTETHDTTWKDAGGYLMSLGRARGLQAADAEDAAQLVLVVAWKRLAPPPRTPRARWFAFLRSAHRMVTSCIRRAARRRAAHMTTPRPTPPPAGLEDTEGWLTERIAELKPKLRARLGPLLAANGDARPVPPWTVSRLLAALRTWLGLDRKKRRCACKKRRPPDTV